MTTTGEYIKLHYEDQLAHQRYNNGSPHQTAEPNMSLREYQELHSYITNDSNLTNLLYTEPTPEKDGYPITHYSGTGPIGSYLLNEGNEFLDKQSLNISPEKLNPRMKVSGMPTIENFSSFSETAPGLSDTTVGNALALAPIGIPVGVLPYSGSTTMDGSSSSSTSSSSTGGSSIIGSGGNILSSIQNKISGVETDISNAIDQIGDKVSQVVGAKTQAQPAPSTGTHVWMWIILIILAVVLVTLLVIGGRHLYKKHHNKGY